MKKIPLKRIFAAAALVCCLTVTTAYADVTQEDIDNAKNGCYILSIKSNYRRDEEERGNSKHMICDSSVFRINSLSFWLIW